MQMAYEILKLIFINDFDNPVLYFSKSGSLNCFLFTIIGPQSDSGGLRIEYCSEQKYISGIYQLILNAIQPEIIYDGSEYVIVIRRLSTSRTIISAKSVKPMKNAALGWTNRVGSVTATFIIVSPVATFGKVKKCTVSELANNSKLNSGLLLNVIVYGIIRYT